MTCFNLIIENTADKTSLEFKGNIVIDLNDDNTKKQFDALKDFLDVAIPSNSANEFFQFAKTVSDNYHTYYKIFHKQQDDNDGDDEQALKINLDSSDFDAAITKADNLIAKLKEIDSLVHSICTKDFDYSFHLSRR